MIDIDMSGAPANVPAIPYRQFAMRRLLAQPLLIDDIPNLWPDPVTDFLTGVYVMRWLPWFSESGLPEQRDSVMLEPAGNTYLKDGSAQCYHGDPYNMSGGKTPFYAASPRVWNPSSNDTQALLVITKGLPINTVWAIRRQSMEGYLVTIGANPNSRIEYHSSVLSLAICRAVLHSALLYGPKVELPEWITAK